MGPPSTPGNYLLELVSRRSCRVRIGRLGFLQLVPGHYYYTGSAFGPGGLAARVTRVCYSTSSDNHEHAWSAVLSALPGVEAPLHGFGASDCGCPAHLCYSGQPLAEVLLRSALAAGNTTETVILLLQE